MFRVRLIDLSLVLVLEASELVLECGELAGSSLQPHLCISLTYLELLSTAHFVLIGLHQLRLGLLMSPILLLIVANFVVELFQIVLEGHDLVLHCPDRILKAHNIFVTLLSHLALVPNSILSRLNLRLNALHRVLRSLV